MVEEPLSLRVDLENKKIHAVQRQFCIFFPFFLTSKMFYILKYFLQNYQTLISFLHSFIKLQYALYEHLCMPCLKLYMPII
jgi:hypothetical protein